MIKLIAFVGFFASIAAYSRGLTCDRGQVAAYVKNEVARYNSLVKAGKLTHEEAQALTNGTDSLVEMNALSCGWVKPAPAKPRDFCESAREDRARWAKQKAKGALSASEFNSLIGGQKDLSKMAGVNCFAGSAAPDSDETSAAPAN